MEWLGGMDIGVFVLFLLGFTVIFFVIQRAEAKKRLVVALCMIIPIVLIQRYANYRALHTEALVAFLGALALNFLFWLFVGRYNPVGSSDDNIQVIGMDD